MFFASACNSDQVNKGANGSGTAESLARDSTPAGTGDMNQRLDTPSGTNVKDTGSVLTDSTIKQ
ncbi:hypothetical protein C7T94_09060 [Pedobacter yulinensis]|uniref:Uncharacterized protein n=2 Tax=Pedobacter yulinensis TaxID=2126353 RepID=A0A2T3HK23_9SPHI|nr:hypothetical protein C7T94_09060 [Pedobacter yulinensis]